MSTHSASFAFSLVVLMLCLASGTSRAATRTVTLSVSATVISSCHASSAALESGSFRAASASARSSVAVNCTNPTPYNIDASAGQAANPAAGARQSIAPFTAQPEKTLLPDFARSFTWNRPVSAGLLAGTGIASTPSFAFSGQDARVRYVAPGAYADTIVVTIIY